MDVNQREEIFLQLSASLTGIAVSSFAPIDRGANIPGQIAKVGDLEARNSPIRLAPVYLQLLDSWNDGKAIEEALARTAAIKAPRTIQELINEFMQHAELGPLCKSIIKLWYLGVWYAPDQHGIASHVVSSQAYVESLVWKVMQAHPAGYSMGVFGHWSDIPPSLDSFVTIVK